MTAAPTNDTVPAVALTIAGSDPIGGAGLQADLKTFQAHRVYGMSVVTLLTVQNTAGVRDVQMIAPEFVQSQLRGVLDDIVPGAAKTGALGSAAIIACVAEAAADFDFPLVVDPVMVSKHGHSIIDDDAIAVLKSDLLPHADLLVPNRFEAEKLSGVAIESEDRLRSAGDRLRDAGPSAVLIKTSIAGESIDALFAGDRVRMFRGPRIDSGNTHGSGCVLAAAITAGLAKGQSLESAIIAAIAYVRRGIARGPAIGQGIGPLDLFSPGGREA